MHGRENYIVLDNLCPTWATGKVYPYPFEYNTFGGSTSRISTRLDGTSDGKKTFRIADHLGSNRVYMEEGLGINIVDYEPFGKAITGFGSNVPRQSFIDKEKDFENGLGDFGVRKYEEETGRFLSVDPLWEKGRSHSPYLYGFNRPLSVIDPDGRWGKEIHDKIIDRAFTGILTPDERQVLKDASVKVDAETQGAKESFHHAMRAPGQSTEDAREDASDFAYLKMSTFANKAGNDGLSALGEGMHPIMDNTSPSHSGFQEWSGLPGNVVELLDLAIHGQLELAISEKLLEATASRLRDYYKRATQLQADLYGPKEPSAPEKEGSDGK